MSHSSILCQVPMEESDLGKRNGLKGQAVRTDDLTMKEQRFLVSALVNTPLNLTFEYKYGDAGAYEVNPTLCCN